MHFECSNSQGAALVTKYPAFRKDTFRDRDFIKYMSKHRKSWLAFFHDHLGIQLELPEIVLVTGCDLTADWATAVFIKSYKNAAIYFTAGDSSIVSGQASLWGSWKTSVNIPHRCGPSQASKPPTVGDIVPYQTSSQAAEVNQCIFIRGLRMKERQLVLPPKIKAAAGYTKYNKHHDTDNAPISDPFSCRGSIGDSILDNSISNHRVGNLTFVPLPNLISKIRAALFMTFSWMSFSR